MGHLLVKILIEKQYSVVELVNICFTILVMSIREICLTFDKSFICQNIINEFVVMMVISINRTIIHTIDM